MGIGSWSIQMLALSVLVVWTVSRWTEIMIHPMNTLSSHVF